MEQVIIISRAVVVRGRVAFPHTAVAMTLDELARYRAGEIALTPAPPTHPAADMSMTRAQLVELVEARGMSAPSRATKAQLLELLGG